MHESLSISLILRGIGAVALGVMALVWPGVTVLVLVILFAVIAFIGAGVQAVLAFNSTTGGVVFGHLLLGLADLTAGVIALAWPGPTALVLVVIVGCWAIFVGLFQVFVVSRATELSKSRALFILGGLGAVARMLLDGAVGARAGRALPLGTLAVNLTGAFALAVLAATLSGDAYRIAGTGFLGAFTTFSTWMFESQRLAEDGRRRAGALNILVSLALGLSAAWLGRHLGAAI